MMSGTPSSGICGRSRGRGRSRAALTAGYWCQRGREGTRHDAHAGPFGEPSPVAVLAPVDELLVAALAPRPEPP